MERRGILLTCDRCGKEDFLEEQETTDPKSKPCRPDGWIFAEGRLLCPTCNTAYKSLVDDFFLYVRTN